MDAKAKVVRWRLRSPKDRADYMSQERDGQYVLFTDHEAELAELMSERDAWQRLAGEWQQATERRKEENQTLISGLEALAGEWEKTASAMYARHNKQRSTLRSFTYFDKAESIEQCAEELRTLASAGLEGDRE